MSILLTRRAVVQVGIEPAYGQTVSLGNDDGVLVSEPMFEVDANVLERDFTRDSISQTPHIMGRKVARMTFSTELRGNGKQNSGNPVDAAIITRLFRMCGYQLNGFTDPTVKGVFDVGDHANQVSWASDVSNADNEDVISYFIEVVVPGASGVAQVAITSDMNGEGSATTPAIAATGSIAFSDQPDEGSTITLNGTVWTFVSTSPAAGEVLIGGTTAATVENLANALNLSNDVETAKATYAAVGTTLQITFDVPGTVGNAWTLAASGSSNGTVSGGTLSGGAAAVAGLTVTSGSPLNVGTRGLVLTPTFTGNLAAGQKWVLWLRPSGIALDPISDDFESGTLAMNKDGVLHVMPGAYGTFDIEATAGEYARINWEFTGLWRQPVDAPLAQPNYERTLPSMVELARLRMEGFYAIVEQFTFDQANDIQVRPDVSSAQGYIGTRIVSRNPEGGINPEADLVANNDFWGQMARADRMPFQMRVGFDPGNTVWMTAPGVQYTGLTYQDRNGILAYDAGLKFPAYDTNDEISFFFC